MGAGQPDATGPAFPAAAAMIIALVGVKLVRALAWPTAVSGAHAWHGVERGNQHHAVVPVGAAQRDAKRRAASVRDEVALRAGPAAIRRVWADLGGPVSAAKLALSSAARLQSSCPAGSVSTRAKLSIDPYKSLVDHALCLIPSATRAPLAKRKRRREAGTVLL